MEFTVSCILLWNVWNRPCWMNRRWVNYLFNIKCLILCIGLEGHKGIVISFTKIHIVQCNISLKAISIICTRKYEFQCWAICVQSICPRGHIFSYEITWRNQMKNCDLKNGGYHLDLYSLSSKMSYRQILWSLKDVRSNVIMIISLWNLTGIFANFRWLKEFKPKSWGIETSQDLAVRPLTTKWIEALLRRLPIVCYIQRRLK